MSSGVYFTQFPSYGIQYAGDYECLLLSWVLMGKVYPVTESVSSQNTLLGKEIEDPFNSHYVLVKRQGKTSFADVARFDEKERKFDAGTPVHPQPQPMVPPFPDPALDSLEFPACLLTFLTFLFPSHGQNSRANFFLI
jgi:hypothetical protein